MLRCFASLETGALAPTKVIPKMTTREMGQQLTEGYLRHGEAKSLPPSIIASTTRSHKTPIQIWDVGDRLGTRGDDVTIANASMKPP
jgi:hypothetical protein